MAERLGKNRMGAKKSPHSYLLYFLLCLIFLLALWLLWPTYRQYREKQHLLIREQEELARLQQQRNERNRLANELENSPEAIERVAREKFHMVKEGETVMVFPEVASESGK